MLQNYLAAYPKAPLTIGMILSFSTGAYYGNNLVNAVATKACPTSCFATVSFSIFPKICRFFSTPILDLSIDSSKCYFPTTSTFSLAAKRAASFTTLAKSAPVSPVVAAAISLTLTSYPRGNFLSVKCTFKMCSRPTLSGMSTVTRRSNRPGRRIAWSKTSARLVAAITTI